MTDDLPASVDIVLSTPDDIAMHEYDTLRAEIGRHEEQIFQAFTYSLGGSVAIVSWGLTQRNWAVLLLVPYVLLPAGFLILARVQMEKRIGAYIRFFYERRSKELNWETALDIMTPKLTLDQPESALVVALAMPLFTVGLASVAAAWVIGHSDSQALMWLWIGSGLAGVLVVGILYVMWRVTRKPLTSLYLTRIEGAVQAAKHSDGSEAS